MQTIAPAADPEAFFALGNALLEQGKAGGAAAAFQRCVVLVPNQPQVHYNLGNALLADGRPVEAIEAFLGCLQLAADFGPAYVNLAMALRQLALLDQAREMAELGLRYLPGVPEAMIGLANVLHDMADYAGAVALYLGVLEREPGHAGVLSSLGNTLRALGDLPGALALHQRAVAIAPADPEFQFGLAGALLMAGDFAPGWDAYQWRWRRASSRPRGFGEAWNGEDIAGRTILLHAEQGLGDTLQFVRYAPMVAALGAKVVLEVPLPLLRLVRGLAGITQVVARGDVLPPFNTHCPLLSLPRAFGTRLGTIPGQCPYLVPDPMAVADWRAKLPVGGGLRVGLVWAGGSHTGDAGAHLVDRRRSLRLGDLAPLASIADMQLISLQKDRPADEAASVLALVDVMPAVADFADTAALVATLDLVISVDTAVAHLAGALGRPVWLLSRHDGCWRWLHGRDDSPWYPTMRIYRQHRPGDWCDVIDRVSAGLRAVVRKQVAFS